MAFFQVISQYMLSSDLHLTASIEEGRMIVSIWPNPKKTKDKVSDVKFDIPALTICDTPQVLDDNIEDILKSAFAKLNETVANIAFVSEQIKKAGDEAVKNKGKKPVTKSAVTTPDKKAPGKDLFDKKSEPYLSLMALTKKDKEKVVPISNETPDLPLEEKPKTQSEGEGVIPEDVKQRPLKPEEADKQLVEQGLPGVQPKEESAGNTLEDSTAQPIDRPAGRLRTPEVTPKVTKTSNDEDW